MDSSLDNLKLAMMYEGSLVPHSYCLIITISFYMFVENSIRETQMNIQHRQSYRKHNRIVCWSWGSRLKQTIFFFNNPNLVDSSLENLKSMQYEGILVPHHYCLIIMIPLYLLVENSIWETQWTYNTEIPLQNTVG